MLEALLYSVIPTATAFAIFPAGYLLNAGLEISRKAKDKRRLRKLKRKGISYVS